MVRALTSFACFLAVMVSTVLPVCDTVIVVTSSPVMDAATS